MSLARLKAFGMTSRMRLHIVGLVVCEQLIYSMRVPADEPKAYGARVEERTCAFNRLEVSRCVALREK